MKADNTNTHLSCLFLEIQSIWLHGDNCVRPHRRIPYVGRKDSSTPLAHRCHSVHIRNISVPLAISSSISFSVIHSLDSSEAMEVSAAVYAADKICAQSQKFCAIISGKLAFMVRDSKTPLPLRRRLIRIFGHMFEDITLARLVSKLI